ncbi:MAG: Gfo/Idh/MocA family oxidoreductase [Nitrospinota bacterium]|jgi:predicted dehydrogenase|nr:Gfo/Idh/MocA family oxidoreductase [Nitrospinota bacterium]MDP7370647.1 Gfo/Idh/MocA family oxidoreductase [Nitrospinota bacterium]MDP7505097.1 Gfo/Idh/MocA family oxidoreductase [Nitrospinota bacterium]MDP7664634.1 Gfo/Idh/MocA family oxidoreductase [Nitrospinota bacterium]HJP15052.1 Gfo/Idh/MocA family oxidoreductase [Nitrospinota bacterium]
MSEDVKNHEPLGLALVGCGMIGRTRAQIARESGGLGWLGICDRDEKTGKAFAEEIQADFFTADYRELFGRSEVNAVIVATDEKNHLEPVLAAAEAGHAIMVEKPLAIDARDSARVLETLRSTGVDAVVGYTRRFLRRFLTARERIMTGQLGDISSMTTRAFMNRIASTAIVERADDPGKFTPMVIAGTHTLDLSLWFLEEKTPTKVYASSVSKTMAPLGTKDATFGIVTFEDGAMLSMTINWALPEVWPGSVCSNEFGIVGTEGVLTIDDTHRDQVLATEKGQPAGYTPDIRRNVDFLESYPAGDFAFGQHWGPIRDETLTWLTRVRTGRDTTHATADDGHRNLVISKAMDLSARRGEAVRLPVAPKELEE